MSFFEDLINRIQRHPKVVHGVLWGVALLFFASRLINLDADVPIAQDSELARDGVFYTDEGWYAINAITLHRYGTLYLEGEMNFIVPLPVQQLLHLPTFAVFGPTIIAARMTTVLCFAVIAALVFFLSAKWAGVEAGYFGLFLLLTNYFAFCYSRLALSEFPMIMLVLLAIFCALKAGPGRRGWLYTGLGTLFFVMAMLTKTNALPAFGSLLFALAWVNWDQRDWWKKPLAAFLSASLILAAHKVFTRVFFPHEVEFFHSINLAMHLDLNIYNAWERFIQLQNDLRRTFPIFRYALFYAVPVALIVFPRMCKNPLIVALLIFVAGYTGILLVYDNPQPRYWVPYVPCALIVLAYIFHELIVRAREVKSWWVGVWIWGALAAVSIGDNVLNVVKVMRHPEYTIEEMAESINEWIRETSGQNPQETILLGHFTHMISLYGGPKPLNDLYASWPLEFRLDRFQPKYLITQDDIETNFMAIIMKPYHKNPADWLGREILIKERYDLDLLEVYDALGNYEEYKSYLYRLYPEGEAPPGDLGVPDDQVEKGLGGHRISRYLRPGR